MDNQGRLSPTGETTMSKRNVLNNKRLLTEFVCLLVPIFVGIKANALPAFARREDVSCSMCQTNGSAPHLTKAGYMFRRAGYRMPADIGNKGVDEKHFTVNRSEERRVGK